MTQSEVKPSFIHGTINGYNNHSCRCEDCKRSNTQYCLERRKKGPHIKCTVCGRLQPHYAKDMCRNCWARKNRKKIGELEIKPEDQKLAELEQAFKATKQGQKFYDLLNEGYVPISVAHSDGYSYACDLQKSTGQKKRFFINSKYVYLVVEMFGAKRVEPLWKNQK